MTKTRLGGSGSPLPEDGYGRNRLPYPFSYVVDITQDYNIDVIEPDEPGVPDDICNLYVLALTPQQELWFVSALQAGADLIYPTFWQDIMNLWDNARLRVNTFDFVACGGGEDIPTFCERVLQCIEDAPPGNQPGLDDFPDIEAQQKAIVCGALEFAVAEIMQQGEVVLDIIEAAANVANALADILQNYARFGAVPTAVQGAVSGLLGAVVAARSEWQAQSTEDAIRCGLYCAVIEAGGPPYVLSEAILGEGYDLALAELGPLTLKGLVLEATWYFIPKRLVASRFQVGVDQGLSSGLCDTLCEPCSGNWSITWTGTALDSLTIVDGVFSPGFNYINVEYLQGDDGDWANRAIVRYNPGQSFVFVGAAVAGFINKGSVWNGGTNNMLSVDVTGYQNRWLEQQNVATGGPGVFDFDDPSLTNRSTSQVEFTMRVSRNPNPYGVSGRGSGWFDEIVVYGEGPVPSNLQGGTLTILP